MTKPPSTQAPSTEAAATIPLKKLNFVSRWFNQRLPLQDSIELSQRNIYILPTAAGLMLGVTLLLLLLTSINYQLNLGYLFTFLLGSSVMVATYMTQANLQGLKIQLVAAPAVFANQIANIKIACYNPSKRARYAIAMSQLQRPDWIWTDLSPQFTTEIQLSLGQLQRGEHTLASLIIETRFPIGAFRTWSVWRPANSIWIYPAPELNPPAFPVQIHSESGQTSPLKDKKDELDEVRSYRQGDPFNHILWKRAAKTFSSLDDSVDDINKGLLSKTHSPQSVHLNKPIALTLASTQLKSLEASLSRLCAWVLLAEAQSLSYSLELAGLQLAASNGPLHQQNCLQALASFGQTHQRKLSTLEALTQ